MARPCIEVDIGGTLAVVAPESGTVSAATITITRGTQTLVDEAEATIDGSTLSYAVEAATVDTLGVHLARWSYTVDATPVRHRRQFGVVAATLTPTLTAERLTTYYAGILAGRTHPTNMTHATAIATAWDRLLELVYATGADAYRLLDPSPLEPAHAALAAWVIARNFTPGSATSSDWQAWAQDRFVEAQTLLADALRHATYDTNDDAKITPDETRVNLVRRRLTR